MKLSPAARLILANQYRLLAALAPEKADEYGLAREAVEKGYAGAYPDVFAPIEEAEALTEAECDEVHEIFLMYRALRNAHEGLKDKSGVDPADLWFGGFDANHDPRHGFADWLHRRGQYPELADHGRARNSHGPALATYRRMLAAWRESADPSALTRNDLSRVLAARRGRTP